MAGDPRGDRYEKKQQRRKLNDRARATRSPEEQDEEEAIIDAAKAERDRDPDRYQLKSAGPAGRNDPCPCGSGKKYKKCCGAKK